MTESQQRLNDIMVKWATVVVAFGGFVIAINNYNYQQKTARAQAEQESKARLAEAEKVAGEHAEQYRRRLWERQTDLYLQACKSAGTLATSRDSSTEEYQLARSRFDQLYYGEMCVFESPEVEREMVRFRRALLPVEGATFAERYDALSSPSLHLAMACRYSIELRWGDQFGDELGQLKYKPSGGLELNEIDHDGGSSKSLSGK